MAQREKGLAVGLDTLDTLEVPLDQPAILEANAFLAADVQPALPAAAIAQALALVIPAFAAAAYAFCLAVCAIPMLFR